MFSCVHKKKYIQFSNSINSNGTNSCERDRAPIALSFLERFRVSDRSAYSLTEQNSNLSVWGVQGVFGTISFPYLSSVSNMNNVHNAFFVTTLN